MASMLIAFLGVCQQPYGWMPSLKMLLNLRIKSKVKFRNAKLEQNEYIGESRHDKSNKMSVHPAKTQISLGIRPD